ncbi:MAG: magnesium/cobalt transporter CorA [Acidimicrobiia bacterium]|nr:magnesium/cobalt transporter CorA [Acidimicrobiia bacterium]
MIRAWRYAAGREGRDGVAPGELATGLGAPGTLLWVDVHDPTPGEIDLVTSRLGIHPLAQDDLRSGNQRTKLERYREHFHVAIHECRLEHEALVTREIDVVFGDGWLLSVHQPSDLVTTVAEEVTRRFELVRSGPDHTDVGFLLWALLDVVVDGYFVVTDTVDERLDDVEETVFAEDATEEIPRSVFDLRRALIGFRRVVSPLREVVASLLRREAEQVTEPALVHLQDVYDHVLRVGDLLESQRDVLTGLLEAHLAVASNRMNRVMKATSSWGAIILGSTLIAGIYGMNFRHIPELHWFAGYPMALASMVLLTVVLYRMFRRRGWL